VKPPEERDKADWDALDEAGIPILDELYQPHLEPLYRDEFKAWAKAHLPERSLAVADEQVADAVVAAALQCFRAGRTARKYGHPAGKQGLKAFKTWARRNLNIRSKDPEGMSIATRAYQAGHAPE
jgi:hypothetical protein